MESKKILSKIYGRIAEPVKGLILTDKGDFIEDMTCVEVHEFVPSCNLKKVIKEPYSYQKRELFKIVEI